MSSSHRLRSKQYLCVTRPCNHVIQFPLAGLCQDSPHTLQCSSGTPATQPDSFPVAPVATQLAQVHTSVRFPTAVRSTWKARPIAQFSYYGSISVALVSQYELPQQASNDCPFSMCASAVMEYQHAMCAPHKLVPHEVCWFLNYPHSLASCGSLSVSECARTPECQLSHSLVFWLCGVEAMMLNREHEMLRLVLDPTWHAPDHPYRKPQDLNRPPVRPDDELLCKLYMRCSLNERQPMETVVTEVLTPPATACSAPCDGILSSNSISQTC